jgi:maleate isomerase
MSLPYELRPQIGSAGRAGLIVLRSDETIEAEMRGALGDMGAADVAVFSSRIPSSTEVSTESLAQMEGEIERSAALLPETIDFDVVGYACTSASSVIGSERVAALVGAGCKSGAVTDPLAALTAACAHQGITRLALVSPYAPEVSESLRDALERSGIATPVFGTFNEPVETHVARIDTGSLRDAAQALGADPRAEAVFLSCTNLRTRGALDEMSQALGKPVWSSNHVLFWDMFRRLQAGAARYAL